MFFTCLAAAACQAFFPQPSPASVQPTYLLPTATATASATALDLLPSFTPAVGSFPGPTLELATAIPPPLAPLTIPDEVMTIVLLGLDRDSVYVGRNDATTLVFINPRTARASLVSLPRDLFVYLPGLTMQRISVAYPVGGVNLLLSTIHYNFGFEPEQWVIAHQDDFPELIDDLGGIEVSVLYPIDQVCGGFPSGRLLLNGAQTLCFVRIRQGDIETVRLLRQQEVIRSLFLRMVTGGNLVRLPELYWKYESRIRTNVSLVDLLELIPLGLKLGDPGRIGYYQVGLEQGSFWEIHPTTARVLLPDQAQVRSMLEEAVAFVSAPAPLTERVVTLEYELTISPTPTDTPTPTNTPTATNTRTATPTFTRTVTRTPTITLTRTATRTLTPSPTVTGSLTATNTPTITPSPTDTTVP